MLAPPPFRVRLKQPVGPSQPNKSDDVAALQDALGTFAQYHGKEDAIGRHDGTLDSAIRTVQHRFGLKADGVAKPGGPTEFLLNAILAGGIGGLAPDPSKTPDRSSFQRRLLLKGSVGERGHNHPDDAAVVRHGLALLGHLPLGAVVPGNQLEPKALESGIERFNRRHGRPANRTIAPGSPAAATLAKELGIAYAAKLPEQAAPPATANDDRRADDHRRSGAGAPLLRTAESGPRQPGEQRSIEDGVQVAERKSPAWLQHQVEVLAAELPPERAAKVADTVAAMNAAGDDKANGALPSEQDRLDVLRYYYEEQRLGVRPTLPADLATAILGIYDSLEVDAAFEAAERPLREQVFQTLASDRTLVEGLDDWKHLDREQRRALLQRAAEVFSEVYDLPQVPRIEFGELPGQSTYALFQTDNSVGGFGFIKLDHTHFDAGKGLTMLNDLMHELGHAYQQKLLLDLFAAKLPADDPRRLQVELFALSRAYYDALIKPLRASDSDYATDPNERHAAKLEWFWNLFAQSKSL